MNRYKKQYFYISLALMIITNRILFMTTRLINQGFIHHSMHTEIDNMIPFLPWTIIIYNGVYLWWLQAFWLIVKHGDANRFFAANILAKAITFVSFVFYPTIMKRPSLGNTSLWNSLVRIQYMLDDPDNLFPSIHCVLGWFCWIGLRGKKDIALPWRITAFFMAIAVCLSTLTVRQHVFLDVFAGIALSEACHGICKIQTMRQMYDNFVHGIIQHFPREANTWIGNL